MLTTYGAIGTRHGAGCSRGLSLVWSACGEKGLAGRVAGEDDTSENVCA